MSGVVDGQAVNASVTNAAFLAKNGDDTASGKITLANTDPLSGASITNVQRELNAHASAVGLSLGQVYNYLITWASNMVGATNDTIVARINAIVAKFSGSVGHAHSGVDGDGAKIAASNLTGVPLSGWIQQGTDLTGVTGSSTAVTTQMSGKTASSGSSTTGVVVTAPYNKTVLRQTGTGADQDIKDSSGNTVYGRITFAASVWTLSYYSEIAGVETAYSFSGSNGVRWYYQELFNPLASTPIYDPALFIPSDNATADVVDASATQRGLVNTGAQTFGGVKTHQNEAQFAELTTPATPATGFVKIYPKSDGNFYKLGPDGVETQIGSGGGALNITGSTGAPQAITTTGGIAFSGPQSRSLWFVAGSGGAVSVTKTPQIAAGTTVGQELVLIGTSDTNTLTLSEVTGSGLSLNGSVTLYNNSNLYLFWNGTAWAEISRRP